MASEDPGTHDMSASSVLAAYSYVPAFLRRRISRLSSYRSRKMDLVPPTEDVATLPPHSHTSNILLDDQEVPVHCSRPSSSRPSSSGFATAPGARTPPPGYLDTIASDEHNSKSGDQDYFSQFAQGRGKAPEAALSRDTTGISWTWAAQGMEMLRLCTIQQTISAGSNTLGGRADFDMSVRSLYIRAITYLLRALPTELSTDEHHMLYLALPASMGSRTLERSSRQMPSHRSGQDKRQPSQTHTIIRYTARSFAYGAVVLFSLLLPIVLAIIAALKTLIERHHLKQRLVSIFFALLEILAVQARKTGQHGMRLYQQIRDAHGDTVEQAFWMGAMSLTNGVKQGLSEGLGAVQQRPETRRPAWAILAAT